MAPNAHHEDEDRRTCQWVSQSGAFTEFATFAGKTESAAHIKPLHWYVACRLVIEGGFHPDDIVPRPPFAVKKSKGEWHLSYDPGLATGGEQTVLGGLKTKNVDVVVSKRSIGPVLAVSCKGVTGAFRNLTNRMEETVGECTNLHITYPALVFGFLVAIRANRVLEKAARKAAKESDPPAKQLAANDIAILQGGEPVEGIIRFHAALRELTNRRGIRNDVSRYEAISLAMIDMTDSKAGAVLADFPPEGSPLRIENFFASLYLRYDERYVFSAPKLESITRRLEWSRTSDLFERSTPAASTYPVLDFEPRLSRTAEDN
jgi:hypothetical protein